MLRPVGRAVGIGNGTAGPDDLVQLQPSRHQLVAGVPEDAAQIIRARPDEETRAFRRERIAALGILAQKLDAGQRVEHGARPAFGDFRAVGERDGGLWPPVEGVEQPEADGRIDHQRNSEAPRELQQARGRGRDGRL